jgi:hypothetical protein
MTQGCRSRHGDHFEYRVLGLKTIGSARKTRSKFCVLHGRRAAETRINGGRVGDTTRSPSSRGRGGVRKGSACQVEKRGEYQMRFHIL